MAKPHLNKPSIIIDKFLHLLVCLGLTLWPGPVYAIMAAVLKEALDQFAKHNVRIRIPKILTGTGWSWLDILADAIGILIGTILISL